MVDNKARKECCGCTACEAICPYRAITMQPDKLGFLYPTINKELCVECGLCMKVCAFNSSYNKSHNLATPKVYGARHKDMNEVATSRSGAVFIALSDWILSRGGVVYGAGYRDHFEVAHKRATTSTERDEFKGSKYVQSNLNGIFSQIKDDLTSGKLVLFSGTPCQASGLISFVGERLRDKLYAVDLICHGVPAPYVWREYVAYIENKQGKQAIKVCFSDKSRSGWSESMESFTFDDGVYYSNSFKYLFLQDIMCRESCEVCPFTNTVRPADITIGDFWGIERVDSHFNIDDKGCSLVLCNTSKGTDWFDKVKDSINIIECSLEQAMQPSLIEPLKVNTNRATFENDFGVKDFNYIITRYGDRGVRYIIREIRKYISRLPMRFKRIIKRLIK